MISGKLNSEHAGMTSQSEPDPAVDLRVTTTLSQVVDVLNAQGAQYALIGGLGVALRGNVRATQDVDILMQRKKRERKKRGASPLLRAPKNPGVPSGRVSCVRLLQRTRPVVQLGANL